MNTEGDNLDNGCVSWECDNDLSSAPLRGGRVRDAAAGTEPGGAGSDTLPSPVAANMTWSIKPSMDGRAVAAPAAMKLHGRAKRKKGIYE